jgi:hypothetical protein
MLDYKVPSCSIPPRICNEVRRERSGILARRNTAFSPLFELTTSQISEYFDTDKVDGCELGFTHW